jgi:hypothetical protein
MAFKVEEPAGILELTAPLSDCFISSDAVVVLSSPAGKVQIGPRFALVADELEVEGEQFIAVGGGEEKFGGLIYVSARASHHPQLKVLAYPQSSLSVCWPDMWHQWMGYKFSLSKVGAYIKPDMAYQILFWSRKILNSVKSNSRDAPSVYGELLDKLIIGVNPIARATLNALIEVGVVALDGLRYTLQLEKLRAYKVNYISLHGSNFESHLAELHGAICRTDAILNVVSKPA